MDELLKKLDELQLFMNAAKMELKADISGVMRQELNTAEGREPDLMGKNE